MARTSSLNCLSCRNPYQTPHSLNCLPPFSLKKTLFSLTEKCFVASPSQNPAPTPQNHNTHETVPPNHARNQYPRTTKRTAATASGAPRTNQHYSYSYSFPVFLAECSYRKDFPSGLLKKFRPIAVYSYSGRKKAHKHKL